ncbi:MAG: hypothetical protein KDA44_04820, partial [Planctomycetales bacterium]|nr:hypothetical protein [Planctomycetales bacterium]
MTATLEQVRGALAANRPAEADRLATAIEAEAFAGRKVQVLAAVWPLLADARRQRRARAAGGRI